MTLNIIDSAEYFFSEVDLEFAYKVEKVQNSY